MRQYLELLRHVLEHGAEKADRAGGFVASGVALAQELGLDLSTWAMKRAQASETNTISGMMIETNAVCRFSISSSSAGSAQGLVGGAGW